MLIPDRAEVIKTLKEMRNCFVMSGNVYALDYAIDRIEGQEAAWIQQGNGYDDDGVWMCDKCRNEFILLEGTPFENSYYYCPHCGAKMGKEVMSESEL